MSVPQAEPVRVIALRGFVASPGNPARPGECVPMAASSAHFAINCGHARLATEAELIGPGERDDDEGDEEEEADKDEEPDEDEEGEKASLPPGDPVKPEHRDPAPQSRDPKSRKR